MKTATITEAKNGLSALIDRVRAGETVILLDRGVPVARLEPVTTLVDPVGRIRRLERSGALRAGDGSSPLAVLQTSPPPLTSGTSAVAALLEERRAGR